MILTSLLSIIIIVISSILLVAIALFLILKVCKKGKKNNKKVDIDYVNRLIDALGGKTNIVSVSVENARLKFKLHDVKVPNFDLIKELGANGVFITGNDVKMIVNYDAKQIEDQINKML